MRNWTPRLVERTLVAAFRAIPTLPIHSTWTKPPVASIDEVEVVLNWRQRFLAGDPRDHLDWTMLALRAGCLASGEKALPLVLGLGWSRKRYEAGWRRAAVTIAAGLNDEAVNTAALLAGAAAEARMEAEGRIAVTCGSPTYVRLDKGTEQGGPVEAKKNREIRLGQLSRNEPRSGTPPR